MVSKAKAKSKAKTRGKAKAKVAATPVEVPSVFANMDVDGEELEEEDLMEISATGGFLEGEEEEECGVEDTQVDSP